MREKYKINFQPEVCCDYCNDIIHNHFDCPVCKVKWADASIYGPYWDEDEFECEKCKAKFKIVDRPENIWEHINENPLTEI